MVRSPPHAYDSDTSVHISVCNSLSDNNAIPFQDSIKIDHQRHLETDVMLHSLDAGQELKHLSHKGYPRFYNTAYTC